MKSEMQLRLVGASVIFITSCASPQRHDNEVASLRSFLISVTNFADFERSTDHDTADITRPILHPSRLIN
jgi:hypothetical protein